MKKIITFTIFSCLLVTLSAFALQNTSVQESTAFSSRYPAIVEKDMDGNRSGKMPGKDGEASDGQTLRELAESPDLDVVFSGYHGEEVISEMSLYEKEEEIMPYRIQPGDVVEITVYGSEHMHHPGLILRISVDGSVVIPLLGRITLGGAYRRGCHSDDRRDAVRRIPY